MIAGALTVRDGGAIPTGTYVKVKPRQLGNVMGEEHLWLMLSGHGQFCGSKMQSRT